MSSSRAILALALAAGACKAPQLAPGPALEDFLEASFRGARAFEVPQLERVVLDELSSDEDPAVTRAEVDDAAYALELFYRDEGYPDCEVRYDFEQEGSPRARFLIDEGPLVRLRTVRVQGVQQLDREQLDGVLGSVVQGEPFVRSRLGRVTGALRSYYLGAGFLSVEVDEPVVERVAEDAMTVAFEVREGPRFVLREASVQGAVTELEEDLGKLCADALGRPFVPHLAYELRAGVLREHAEAGYPDCEVEVQTDKDETSGAVRVVLATNPGPLVTIAGIDVRGNADVPAKRVRARVELEPGERYDAERINRSFDLLYATGLFDAVGFELEGEGPERTLVVEVDEAPSLQLFAEPGWGSYEGPRIRLGVDENNLLSTARRGKLEGWISPLARGIEAELADPFLFGTPVRGELSFLAHDREEPSFTVDEVGTGLDFRRSWTDELSTTLGVSYRETTLSDVDLSGSVPQAFLNSVDIGELTFALSYDTRDNALVTRRGGLARFHTAYATEVLGSSLEAFSSGLDLLATLPLGEHTFLAGAARASFIAPYGDSNAIPLQFRKFNGGENSVRSFKESELGPLDPGGEPIGGEARTLLSLELRKRISGNVSGALFYDLGNVQLDYEDYFAFDDFRHGVGLGLRYLLPIGPLRLDAAWNPDHASGESEWVVHFAVGLPY